MIEKKITSEGYEELFYRPEDGQGIIQAAVTVHPWLSTDNISMVSKVESINKINITYNCLPSEQLFAMFDVQPYHIMCDYHAVEITDDQIILKIYDINLVHYRLPSLPPGAQIDSYGSGIGVIYKLGEGLSDLRKVYYILNDKFYGLEYYHDTLMQKSISEYHFEGSANTW